MAERETPDEWARVGNLAKHLVARAQEVSELVGNGKGTEDALGTFRTSADSFEGKEDPTPAQMMEFLAASERLVSTLEGAPPTESSRVASSERVFMLKTRGAALVSEKDLRQGVGAALDRLAKSGARSLSKSRRELLDFWRSVPHSKSGAQMVWLAARDVEARGSDIELQDFCGLAALASLKSGGDAVIWGEIDDTSPLSRLGTTRGIWPTGEATAEATGPGDQELTISSGRPPHTRYVSGQLFNARGEAAPLDAGLTRRLVDLYRTVEEVGEGPGATGGGEGLSPVGTRLWISEDAGATTRLAGRSVDPPNPPNHLTALRRAQWGVAVETPGLWAAAGNPNLPHAPHRRRYADWSDAGHGLKGILSTDLVMREANEVLKKKMAAVEVTTPLETEAAELDAASDGLAEAFFPAAARGVDLSAGPRARAEAPALQREQALTALTQFEMARRTLAARLRREDPAREYTQRLQNALAGRGGRRRQVMKKEVFQPQVGQKLAHLLGSV